MQLSNPIFSIIIPTYNRADDLQRALKSVIDQTLTSWEAIVVDNFSNDHTENIISSFSDTRIKYFKFNNEGLIARSRNYGIVKSVGEFVAFLDSDDWWKPKKLEITLESFKPKIDLIFHELFLVNYNNKFFYKKTLYRKLDKPVYLDLLKNGNCINNSSVVVKKCLLDLAGPLPENIELNAFCDYEAWLHISKYSNNFLKIPYTLGYYWMGGGNYTNNEKTLKSLDALENKYIEELNRFSSKEFYWINYNRAVIFFKMKNMTRSKYYLQKVLKQKTPFKIYLKATLILIAVNFFIIKD